METQPTPPDKRLTAKLSSIGDVRRELARLYLRLKRQKVKAADAGVASNILATLAKTMEHSIRDYSDEEILAEWDRRREARKGAEQ